VSSTFSFRFGSFLTFLLLSSGIFAQKNEIAKNPNRFKIVALPVVFYTPDTKWSGGTGGLSTFNFPKDSLGARRSSVTVGVVYTQLRQVLLYFPFQLFPNNQRYWISGEVGYYRYVFNFFGTGNAVAPEYIEKYDARFPRIRLNASRKIGRGLYAGLRYAYDDFTFTRTESGGWLERGLVSGSDGGRISGVGVGMNYDTRDVLFFPKNGWLADVSGYAEGAATGSQFEYQRLSGDVACYRPLGRRGVLALNAAAVLSWGDVPFHQMPVIGGTKRMRGYFEGKYRDKHLLLLQGEVRQPLFWRIGAVGMVAPSLEALSLRHTRYNFGTGLRFVLDKTQKINIRADYGWGYRSSGFYLTFGEAF
jgi:outer membrane protein assembly factor BamA